MYRNLSIGIFFVINCLAISEKEQALCDAINCLDRDAVSQLLQDRVAITDEALHMMKQVEKQLVVTAELISRPKKNNEASLYHSMFHEYSTQLGNARAIRTLLVQHGAFLHK